MKFRKVPKNSGNYRYYGFCRFCFSKDVETVINLGHIPLAGGFLPSLNPSKIKKEKLYPLEIGFCNSCFLLQTKIVVDAPVLFKNYYYFTSFIKTLVDHFRKLSQEFEKIHKDPKNKFVVEIGCNDGLFISDLQDKGFKVLGVDPASNVVRPLIKRGVPIINDYFTQKLAKKIEKKYGKADHITSSNTLAHIEDMRDIMRGISLLLSDKGILTFEVHYLGKLIEKLQYDMIYHEHQYYYSLHTLTNFLQQFNLKIYDVKETSIHSGSIRIYAQKANGKRKIMPNVKRILAKEKKQKLMSRDTFINFDREMQKHRVKLKLLISNLNEKGLSVMGYGASGRATTIINYCSLGNELMPYVIDDSTVKQGAYIPGEHQKIINSEILYSTKRPQYVVLFAWAFYKEILNKHKEFLDRGGKFIVPLPKIKIIDWKYINEK